jgi:2-keto-4-pentenoate hydratase/2-oxohepta-3-ene-1,7-dioic acid hydratase in catechol pathway
MKIICIGRNYAEHAKELNNPLPSSPVFFMKPETSLLTRNRPFYYPDFSTDIHYETEIVLRICKVGKNISERFAHTYFDAIGLGIDFTARDLQQKAKEQGLPWESAKAFDNSAPISEFVQVSDLPDVHNLEFKLLINGIQVQKGVASEMIFSYEKIISYISRFVTLKMGDLIFTGTPAGVGPVSIGDHLEAFLGERKMLSFLIK